ncbi:MAG: sulfotransferase [Gammaproteobacteria bacterium]|jgi:hypothetical protein
MSRKPILITGCQRSGTTLMNLILNSHPRILSIDEDRFSFPFLYSYLYAPLPGAPDFVAFKLPRYAHMLPFIEMLPAGKVLWCIRDPLDVVASMVKLRLNMQMGGADVAIPWAAHPDGGWYEINSTYWALDEEQKRPLNAYMAEFGRLTEKFMNLAAAPENLKTIERRDCVFIGALCWRIKNYLPSLYRERNIDFQTVRYEDLVTNPGERIAELLAYLGAEWSDEVLMHHRHHSGTSIGETANTRAIDRRSLGTGKNSLSVEERELAATICGETAAAWNYSFD